MGFSSHLGAGSITEAELWAISMGLKLVRVNGFSRGVVESDSLAAVKLIRNGCFALHPCFTLVKEIHNFLYLAEEWTIAHTMREGNQAADGFTKFGLGLVSCSVLFRSVAGFASHAVTADVAGTYFPRGF